MSEPSEIRSSRSIQEFWIDFLLEEELRCDPSFAQALASACGLSEVDPASISVSHSVNDEYGEADLIVIFMQKGGRSVAALLLENKINASFQPGQAERYRSRGEAGLASDLWQTYRTVLIAPSAYVRRGHGFDVALTYETLGDWICINDPVRRAFKLERIQRAIEKKNTNSVKIVDATMTSFRSWYSHQMDWADLLSEGFVTPTPRRAYWDDNWVQWTSSRLPASCEFRHMTRKGIIELGFKNTPIERMDWVRPLLEPSMQLKSTGKHKQHTAIQVSVPPISNFADLDSAMSTVRLAFQSARRMQELVLSDIARFTKSLAE